MNASAQGNDHISPPATPLPYSSHMNEGSNCNNAMVSYKNDGIKTADKPGTPAGILKYITYVPECQGTMIPLYWYPFILITYERASCKNPFTVRDCHLATVTCYTYHTFRHSGILPVLWFLKSSPPASAKRTLHDDGWIIFQIPV